MRVPKNGRQGAAKSGQPPSRLARASMVGFSGTPWSDAMTKTAPRLNPFSSSAAAKRLALRNHPRYHIVSIEHLTIRLVDRFLRISSTNAEAAQAEGNHCSSCLYHSLNSLDNRPWGAGSFSA